MTITQLEPVTYARPVAECIQLSPRRRKQKNGTR